MLTLNECYGDLSTITVYVQVRLCYTDPQPAFELKGASRIRAYRHVRSPPSFVRLLRSRKDAHAPRIRRLERLARQICLGYPSQRSECLEDQCSGRLAQ